MKTPTPRKLPSGTWFIQLRLGGESVSVTARTERECVREAQLVKAEYLAGKREKKPSGADMTLGEAMDRYVADKRNVLSPSTVRGYMIIRNNRFQSVMNKPITKILNWQSVCNDEANICGAKTLKNAWLYVKSILRANGIEPPKVTLPQVVIGDRPFLEPEQIPAFLSAIKDKPCETAALLALHGMRVSELCAVTWSDVDLTRRQIRVSGAMVPDESNSLVAKDTNKNASSRRYIPIMIDRLAELLYNNKKPAGTVVDISPTSLYKQINRCCRRENLPCVGNHGLRHSFASLAYHLGVPEKVTMQIGGWSDTTTMHKIYTHIAQRDMDKHQSAIIDFFKYANKNANA